MTGKYWSRQGTLKTIFTVLSSNISTNSDCLPKRNLQIYTITNSTYLGAQPSKNSTLIISVELVGLLSVFSSISLNFIFAKVAWEATV